MVACLGLTAARQPTMPLDITHAGSQVYLNAYIPLSPSPVQKPIVSYDELPEDLLYGVDLFLKVGESNGYDTRMADLSAVAVDGVPMQLVPLLAWSGNGATQDMAKVFEWMLREFLLANLRGARRVDKSRISNLHARGQNVGRTEYIFVPQGAFYHARVCSDADLLDTVLNMLERM